MIEDKIQQNIPLAPMTTFKIGGNAKFFVEVTDKAELAEALEWSAKNVNQHFILGGGSNVLINDKGVDGLVIKINNVRLEIKGEHLECGAGTFLAKAMIEANREGLGGMEWAIGIPGSVGGAVHGNTGAFGLNIGNVVETVEIFDIAKNKFASMGNQDCRFDYRESVFKNDKNLVIWSVKIRLAKKNQEEIKNTISGYLNQRLKTQPKLPSAGSVFKNITIEDLRSLNKNLARMAEESGVVKAGKVGVGWIIDLLGFRGKTIGGAKVSLEHANFIVNTGKATTEDVIMLISLIKQQARTKFGVQLTEEVQYLGI